MVRNYQIDTLKAFCALLIVFLHTTIAGKEWIVPFTRCAVPCFFMISGFLLYSENKEQFELRAKKGCKHIFRIILWSTTLFAIIRLAFAFKSDDFSFLSFNRFVNFIVFNENPFGFHLWYLSAYLYVLFIALFLNYRNRLKYLIITIPFFFINRLDIRKIQHCMSTIRT